VHLGDPGLALPVEYRGGDVAQIRIVEDARAAARHRARGHLTGLQTREADLDVADRLDTVDQIARVEPGGERVRACTTLEIRCASSVAWRMSRS
jgi:hypothetical protein